MGNFLKETKRQGLLDAAYELFLEKGMPDTTISDIVKRARVAKGTFYLYYRDKDDIFHALSDRISCRILCDALRVVEEKNDPDFAERAVMLADCVIQYFEDKPAVVRLLDKQFSWPRLEHTLTESDRPEIRRLIADMEQEPTLQHLTQTEISRMIFVLVEMVGATCHSSILYSYPAPMDEMKPILFGIIRSYVNSLKKTEE